ncbi:MAG: hypothetical protein HOB82_02240 [Alphaproteobacteria bacterium]|jgi:hypothetical protein|nr:hypothetical protein [Alphaproteobacteria bacterium]MBT4710332.1 hypothetical protein [Alphaproteobacteria bacterium]MBT5859877.1 hypothetical protein [Alphaproteobacteria bacterium]
MAHIIQFPDRIETQRPRPSHMGSFADGWTDAQLQARFGMSDQGFMWLPTAVIDIFFKR